jgi:hypothetical protein
MIYKGKELEEFFGKTNFKFKDLSRKTFGNWYVICRSQNLKNYVAYWCECKLCGIVKIVLAQALLYNKSKMCSSCSKKNKPSQVRYYGNIPYKYFYNLQQLAKKRTITNKNKFTLTIQYLNNLFNKQNKCCAISGLNIGFYTTSVYGSNNHIKNIVLLH